MNGAIMDKEYIKKTIVAALSPLEPEKVILFGSQKNIGHTLYY
jgi:hypothetical protein